MTAPNSPFDPIPIFFKRTSSLSEEEIQKCRKIIGESQPFSIYFNAALEALRSGQDNRWFHFSSSGGLTMGIDFDDLRVFSIIGEVDDEVLAVIGKNPRRTEFHVSYDYVNKLKDAGQTRLLRENKLRYYLLRQNQYFHGNFEGLRRLSKGDLAVVEQFYSQHYDGTIFSSWMLEQPFWGLFSDGQLVAAGGTIVADSVGKAANIGNFLTAPAYRRRGCGKVVAKRLVNDLIEQGIETFTLGTTEENIAAWKTYVAVGFHLLEQRVEVEFAESF